MSNGDLEKERVSQSQKHLHNRSLELIRAVAAFEHAALRPPFLLNGGALIVYMALFGALRSIANAQIDISKAKQAMWAWVVGLLFASAAIALGYYSQRSFDKSLRRHIESLDATVEGKHFEDGEKEQDRKNINKLGRRFRVAATFCVGFSVLAFLVGVYFGMGAVS